MKLLSQPKVILLLVSLLVIGVCVLTGNFITDFHFHDTFYVIHNYFFGIYIGGFLLFQTAVYYITDNYRQWRFIQYVHVISLALILLVSISWILYNILSRPARLLPNEAILLFFLLLFLLGQILFIVNLIAGFIRGKKVLNRTP